jgi:ComF family protein
MYQTQVISSLNTMLSALLDLFYPNLCAICTGHLSKSEEHVCFSCLFNLPKTNHFDIPDNALAKNLWGRVNVKQAVALYDFKKGNPVQDLMHAIKYKNKEELGIFMGKQMGIMAKSKLRLLPDIITSVPLHPKKQIVRGYNQSHLLALGMAEIIDAQVSSHNLVRVSSNDSQTKKNRYERYINVQEKFTILDPSKFENKHVWIVDDVFTTGATLEACIQCLNECKNTSTSAITLAFTI